MSLARSLLLRASRSDLLARQLPRRAFFRRAVRRFMPGEDLRDALDASARLAGVGIGAVLTELGEQVQSAAEALAVRDHYLRVLDEVQARGLPAQISVKLTHLALDADPAACAEHLRVLAGHARATGSFLWIDMEESRYVDATLDMFRRTRDGHTNVGLALQAYLRRTPSDLEALLPLAPTIRLVKGAYNEPADVAFPKKRDVDDQFFALGSRLLAATPAGARPIFGTHDTDLLARLQQQAEQTGVDARAYEVHMLYGIRTDAQHALVAEGHVVKVLISYGAAWFAWYMRRLAERPANVWFVVKNLV